MDDRRGWTIAVGTDSGKGENIETFRYALGLVGIEDGSAGSASNELIS